MTLLRDYKQAHTQNFLLGEGGGADPQAVYNLFLISKLCYKNRVLIITVI